MYIYNMAINPTKPMTPPKPAAAICVAFGASALEVLPACPSSLKAPAPPDCPAPAPVPVGVAVQPVGVFSCRDKMYERTPVGMASNHAGVLPAWNSEWMDARPLGLASWAMTEAGTAVRIWP
jgi:hypothetical protein